MQPTVSLIQADARTLGGDMIVCSHRCGIADALVREVGAEVGWRDATCIRLRDQRLVVTATPRRIRLPEIVATLRWAVRDAAQLLNRQTTILVPLSWRRPEVVAAGMLLFVWAYQVADARLPEERCRSKRFVIACDDDLSPFTAMLADGCSLLKAASASYLPEMARQWFGLEVEPGDPELTVVPAEAVLRRS